MFTCGEGEAQGSEQVASLRPGFGPDSFRPGAPAFAVQGFCRQQVGGACRQVRVLQYRFERLTDDRLPVTDVVQPFQIAAHGVPERWVDFVTKPEVDIARGLAEASQILIEKVKVAARARVVMFDPATVKRRSTPHIIAGAGTGYKTTDKLIAIGASTGGTEAVREVLQELPVDSPGVVVVQHIPGMFSGPFAERMNNCCDIQVKEAEDGDRILQGHAYIAPGDQHLQIVRNGARYCCRLSDAAPVNRHRPSVDVLFESVAAHVGINAIGVILTGMGKDGAKGLKAMHDRGARTLAQSERSSVVWGMPGAAINAGAVDEVLDLSEVGTALRQWATSSKAARAVVAPS